MVLKQSGHIGRPTQHHVQRGRRLMARAHWQQRRQLGDLLADKGRQVSVLAQHDAELLMLLQVLLLLDVLLQLLVHVGLAARHLAGPETVGIHPVLDILGLGEGEEVLVVPVGAGSPSPAPYHGPGLPLNGEASPSVAHNLTSVKIQLR